MLSPHGGLSIPYYNYDHILGYIYIYIYILFGDYVKLCPSNGNGR